MTTSYQILPNYCYDDYKLWEGRWEVIHGIPFAMNKERTPQHQFPASNLCADLKIQLKDYKHIQVYYAVDYLVTDNTILQPDILIITQPVLKDFLDFPPTLVAEVLSPSTALKDRHTKYSIYEKQGIRYYVIVYPDKTEAEVYEFVNG